MVNVFKQLFSSKQEEQTNERVKDKIYREENDVRAKVTYEYPKTPFRFPIDMPEKRTQPREQRKSKRNNARPIQPLHKQREVVKQRPTIDRQVMTVEKKFTPTDVPSPIYGYQTRNKQRAIEEEPAFVRKKEDRKEERRESVTRPVKTVNDASLKKKAIYEEPAFVRKQKRAEMPVTHVEKFQTDITKQKSENDRLSSKDALRARRLKKRQEKRLHILQEDHVIADVSVGNIEQSKKEENQLAIEWTDSAYDVPLHLLNDEQQKSPENKRWVIEQQELLEQTLNHFNVSAKVVHASQGPSVTRFEIQPEIGVKVSKIRNLTDDIKMNMAAKDIRMEAPIPGKNTIGIEIPNESPRMVSLQEVLEDDAFVADESPLTVGLGVNVEGEPVLTDIGDMPHGLIAGATGSGKSVCINTILLSIIYKSSYEDVKLMLIDPKMVELSPYNGIPHLVSPVITDVKAATAALKWAVQEMEDRYERFVNEGVRNISRYNEKASRENSEKMSYLVIVIDELADLMMIAPQDVEDSICRIAQKARACGIHLLIATQRPSVDVITGLIKANIPSRIAFSVSSQVDSRTIIDTNGAERLLGRGDMLLLENGSGKTVRLQGAFVSDDEIERITSYVRKLAEPNYLFEQEQLLKQVVEEEEVDELFNEAMEFVFTQNGISTSLLQRQFRIGYNRAARLIDSLEAKGIISGPNGSKPRELLLTRSQFEDIANL